TDPSWSPDGLQLAFSLFGSIWTINAAGGDAHQVSTSAGYHTHPVWSPDGHAIAFVRGRPPGGRLPYTTGELGVMDLETRRERTIHTKSNVTGSPAWSADSRKIVCPLDRQLHEIDLASGQVERIQAMPRSIPQRPVSFWVDTLWNQKRNEILFVSQRGEAPQIWSIPPVGSAIAIQMPLTRFRPEEVVMLDRAALSPDESSIIYSASHINGRGNYELYRLAYDGGTPQPLTETAHDEFSPAVSSRGEIAYAANLLGNLDLFRMPLEGGEAAHVAIRGLQFPGGSGQVRVRVRDEQGNPTAARLFVRASDGKAYCPPGSPIYYHPLDTGDPREGFFLSRGDDTFPAPAGELEVTALKGLEYEIGATIAEVQAGSEIQIEITLRRWANWSRQGWWSGENHIHLNYNGSYRHGPAEARLWMDTEDLDAANFVVANSEGAFIHDKQLFRGKIDSLSSGHRYFFFGQEFRNSYPLGHMAFLNIRELVAPFFSSVRGSASPYDFPLNTMAAQAARSQGGLVTYVHPMSDVRYVFDTWLGAKELPITAALGAVDSIDVLPFGAPAYELWYRLLNAGFRIAAGAGTDTFANIRGINQIPGGSREYVHVGQEMAWEPWIERYRQGRNFVTSGPLLTFEVNGQPIGALISAPEGGSTAKLVARVVSRAALERIEFVQNGRVIGGWDTPPDKREFQVEKEIAIDGSCWLAVRVEGPPARGVSAAGPLRAHSSPIYVQAGGRPTLVRQDIELLIRWVDRLWALLEQRDNFGSDENKAQAHQMLVVARQHYVEKLAHAR
ncbi:MAG: CehA/McbA family metallohydrolase, partial [Bryobacterales bacterium]